MLTFLSLFSGIGGIDIAAEWAGIKTVGQVEWNDYATKVLEKHWPNVPRWRDICGVTGDEIRRVTGLQSIDIVGGGFPCQPFSVAGKRKGKDDDRFLWPEMLRIVRELRPTWVIGENVNGFVSMGLEDACTDLENEGYAVQAFVIPACAVEALHERKRVFIIAYADGNRRDNGGDNREERHLQSDRERNDSQSEPKRDGWEHRTREVCPILSNTRCELWEGSEQPGKVSDKVGKRDAHIAERPSEMVSDSNTEGPQRLRGQLEPVQKSTTRFTTRDCSEANSEGNIWESEPNVGRVANGIPSRVDRLKCLGNAVVPQQIYPIFKYLAEIENRKEE